MENLLDKIISLAKRRGFIFQSSEIYGGFGSCYDFGPLGAEMKNNIKREWWKNMAQAYDNVVGLDNGLGFAIMIVVKPTALSVRRDSGFIYNYNE